MGHREAGEQAGGHEGPLQRLEGGHRGGDGEPGRRHGLRHRNDTASGGDWREIGPKEVRAGNSEVALRQVVYVGNRECRSSVCCGGGGSVRGEEIGVGEGRFHSY